MADMELNNDFLEEDFGDLAEFGVENLTSQVEITEDLEGFAKGFPSWDLHPPKK